MVADVGEMNHRRGNCQLSAAEDFPRGTWSLQLRHSTTASCSRYSFNLDVRCMIHPLALLLQSHKAYSTQQHVFHSAATHLSSLPTLAPAQRSSVLPPSLSDNLRCTGTAVKSADTFYCQSQIKDILENEGILKYELQKSDRGNT